MADTVETTSKNIRRFRDVKSLSQKEICAESGIAQGQYGRIENGKAEPAVSTPEKLTKVFEVTLAEFFKDPDIEEEVNLPLRRRIKLINTYAQDEK